MRFKKLVSYELEVPHDLALTVLAAFKRILIFDSTAFQLPKPPARRDSHVWFATFRRFAPQLAFADHLPDRKQRLHPTTWGIGLDKLLIQLSYLTYNNT